MKIFALRLILASSLAVSLAACGTGAPEDMTTQTAANVTTGVITSVTTGVTTGVIVTTGVAVNATIDSTGTTTTATTGTIPAILVASNNPAPDCAADGCKSLRIIDGNAEAYRFDAMRRAEAGDPQS